MSGSIVSETSTAGRSSPPGTRLCQSDLCGRRPGAREHDEPSARSAAARWSGRRLGLGRGVDVGRRSGSGSGAAAAVAPGVECGYCGGEQQQVRVRLRQVADRDAPALRSPSASARWRAPRTSRGTPTHEEQVRRARIATRKAGSARTIRKSVTEAVLAARAGRSRRRGDSRCTDEAGERIRDQEQDTRRPAPSSARRRRGSGAAARGSGPDERDDPADERSEETRRTLQRDEPDRDAGSRAAAGRRRSAASGGRRRRARAEPDASEAPARDVLVRVALRVAVGQREEVRRRPARRSRAP